MSVSTTTRIGKDLTNGPILKSLLVFAVPLVLASLIQQLYSMADLIIIGLFVGSEGTVGVSTGGELIDFMTPLATSIAMGGQVYIAQLSGARQEKKIQEAAGTLITLMFGISFLCLFIVLLFYKPILNMLNCPIEAIKHATTYMMITAIGMPFVFGYNAICSILRGMGESKKPLIFVSIAAIVNVFGDLLLVGVFHMDSSGVAIATIGSQFGAFIASFLYMYKNRNQFGFELSLSYFKVKRKPLQIILKMGIPQLVRSLSVHGSMMWVKSNINAFGLVASATYSVGNKLEKLMNVFAQGVDNAAGAMIGQNLGAKKTKRVKKIILTTLCCTMIFGTITSLLFLCIPKLLFGIFTTDVNVIEFGVIFLRIMALGCLITSYAGCFKSIATGAGAAGLCFIIGILDGACRILVCLFFFHVLDQGVQSYFWGAAFCQLIPGIMSMGYFLSGKWKTKKLLSEV